MPNFMHKPGSPFIWVDIPAKESPTGKRIRKSTGTTDMTKAMDFALRVLTESTQQGTQDVTLEQINNEVLAEHWAGTKGYKTNVINGNTLLDILGPDLLVSEINASTVRQLVRELRSDHKTDKTINRKLSHLSVLVNKAEEWGYIKTAPRIRQLKETPGRERIITWSEEEALRGLCSKFQLSDSRDNRWLEMADLITVLIDTGARLGEMLKLQPRMVDTKGRLVTFLWGTTKTSRTRTVPLTERATSIFTKWDGWTLTKDAVESRWKDLRAAMHLQEDNEFVIHALRHTCATRLLEGGMEIYLVGKWLGHSAVSTTERYVHLNYGKLAQGRDILQGTVPNSVPNSVPSVPKSGSGSEVANIGNERKSLILNGAAPETRTRTPWALEPKSMDNP